MLPGFTAVKAAIFPVPLAELPVTEPEVMADIHEYVLPEIVELGVKFNDWFEQMIWLDGSGAYC